MLTELATLWEVVGRKHCDSVCWLLLAVLDKVFQERDEPMINVAG